VFKPLLDLTQVSAALGVSRATIYRSIALGHLPARKIGRRTVVLAKDLEAFVAALPSTREAANV
jgi:excisionase family DNA binding protein